MRNLTPTSLASAALLATALLIAPAAASAQETDQMRVQLGGVDLESQTGSKVALRRIVNASRAFCGDDRSTKSLTQHAAARRCTQKMAYQAVTQLDRPMVTARYEGATVLRPAIVVAAR